MALTTVDELQVVINANANKFNQEIQKVQGQLSKFSGNFNGISGKMATAAVAVGNIIASTFTAAFRAIGQEMDEAVTRLDALNNYPKVMANLGISTQDAEKSISILNEGILGLPTSLSDAALATQRLTAANGNIAASTDMFLALNNAILAGGAPMESQKTALEQMMQAYSKGKPDAMEWRAFLTAMPAQLKQVATEMGYSSTALGGDLQKALVDGEVSMNDFMFAIMKLNNEGINGLPSFAEQAKNATNGVSTAVANLKISIQRAMANIMEVIGQTNISGFINGIASTIDTVSRYIAAFISVIKQAVAWIRALFGQGSGSTNELVKETDEAAAGADALAGSAGEASDNLDDATGAAKKLNKQLASFDEMNTLKEQDQSGSGSSGSGGGGSGVLIPDYDWNSDFLKKTANIIEELANKIREWFSFIDFTALGNSIITLWEGIKNAINGALEAGKMFIDDFIKPLLKYALENTIPRMFEAIGNTLKNIDFHKINKSLDNVFKSASRFGKEILDVIADVTEKISPIITWLANFIVPPALEILATVINTISSVLGGIWDGIISTYDQYIAPALSELGKALEPVLNWIKDIFASLNENEGVWETLKNVVKTVTEIALRPFAVILEQVIGILTWLINTIKSVAEWFGNTFNDIKNVWEEAPDFFNGIFQEAWNFISGIFSGIGNWFNDRWNDVQNAFSSVGNWFNDRFTEARNNVSNAFNDVGNWFNDRWNDVQGALSNVGNWFSDKFNEARTNVTNAFNTVGSWFSDRFNEARNGINNAFSNIGNWFNDRWNDIKNAFGNVWNVFRDIGNNMWEGLKNGLGNIGQKIGDIFSGAVDWVKSIFGISSPSKLFRQFGDYIDQGFVMGIEGGIGDVNNAMANLVNGFEVPEVSLDFGSSMNGQNLNDLGTDSEETPVHLVVNVGGEKLLDQVVNGINDLALLQNRGVINV